MLLSGLPLLSVTRELIAFAAGEMLFNKVVRASSAPSIRLILTWLFYPKTPKRETKNPQPVCLCSETLPLPLYLLMKVFTLVPQKLWRIHSIYQGNIFLVASLHKFLFPKAFPGLLFPHATHDSNKYPLNPAVADLVAKAEFL